MTTQPNYKFLIEPDPEGNNPDAPELQVNVYDGGNGTWVSLSFPGDDKHVLCEVMIDYYHGKAQLIYWDEEAAGGDPTNDDGWIPLVDDPHRARARWNEKEV